MKGSGFSAPMKKTKATVAFWLSNDTTLKLDHKDFLHDHIIRGTTNLIVSIQSEYEKSYIWTAEKDLKTWSSQLYVFTQYASKTWLGTAQASMGTPCKMFHECLLGLALTKQSTLLKAQQEVETTYNRAFSNPSRSYDFHDTEFPAFSE